MSGGAPTVQSAGPWFPADTTHDTLYRFTTSQIMSPIRLQTIIKHNIILHNQARVYLLNTKFWELKHIFNTLIEK